jgi:hypothetical protein
VRVCGREEFNVLDGFRGEEAEVVAACGGGAVAVPVKTGAANNRNHQTDNDKSSHYPP